MLEILNLELVFLIIEAILKLDYDSWVKISTFFVLYLPEHKPKKVLIFTQSVKVRLKYWIF